MGNRNNERDTRPMFRTICGNCGKDCEVPFKPTGSKPVYCVDCYRIMGGSDSKPMYGTRDNKKREFDPTSKILAHPQYKEQFEELNAKLNKILGLIEQK